MDLPASVWNDLDSFYCLLDRLDTGLGGKRRLKDVNEYDDWPPRGVYLLFEETERQVMKKPPFRERMRVTRVGTHAIRAGSKTTLADRLSNHRGYNDGGGSHRTSILREQVGNAILNSPGTRLRIPTWNEYRASKGERLTEKKLEVLVSKYVGNMQMLWLEVEDKPSRESARGYIEANSIALLSHESSESGASSKSWLGRFSPVQVIRDSGLWNIQHVGALYDRGFIRVLERYVHYTLGHRP